MTREEIIKGLESVKKECGRHFDESFAWICEPIDRAIELIGKQQKSMEKFENVKDHIRKLAGDYKCWDNRLTEEEAVELCHILEQQPSEDCVSRAEMLKYQQYLRGKMPNEENHKLWEFIKDLPPVTPKLSTSDDCVSRQAVLDMAITIQTDDYSGNKILDVVEVEDIKDIRALPTVTPTQRWIPVSERLPEPNRLVVCYITTGTTETYFLALWNDIQKAWEEGIGGYRLLERDLGYEVLAWQPLPKPYEEKRGSEK